MAKKEWLTQGIDGLTFGERLGDLISSRGINQSQLAEQTGIKQSAISEYINGRKNGAEPRSPDCATIIELSKFFDVSTDFLLGRTDVQSPSVEIQAIAASTGLTEHTIETLQLLFTRGERTILQDLFNEILEIAFDAEVIGAYCGMRSSLSIQNDQDFIGDPIERVKNQIILSEDAKSQGFAILRGEEAFRFYCSQIADHIRLALHDRHIGSAIWKKEDSHGID